MTDREHAEALAAGIKSFLSSLPYCAPENIATICLKLTDPLEDFETSEPTA